MHQSNKVPCVKMRCANANFHFIRHVFIYCRWTESHNPYQTFYTSTYYPHEPSLHEKKVQMIEVFCVLSFGEEEMRYFTIKNSDTHFRFLDFFVRSYAKDVDDTFWKYGKL